MASAEARLAEVGRKLTEVTSKIRELERERKRLEKEQGRLRDELQKEECDKLLAQDWDRTSFEWSERADLARREVFKLGKFRENQLEVINATLSKHDCLLVMPTGGGKSLTYQLPAVISDGVTLVVSPLISLMEDQLMGLRRLGVGAEMLTGTTDKETKARVMSEMLDKNSQLKLLYVTPEKCSKSKQFMAKLQKMHQAGRFVRLAIDEVHCCSQWGHDFRPDYKFLGAMRELFPDVPILGLTATSTAGVTKDVKEILRIPQALLFMSDFNRPNLRYSVELKPEGTSEQMDLLERLVGREFKGESGIIYTTTVKEVETIAGELKKRGLKVGAYHAQMEPPEARSRVHRYEASRYIFLPSMYFICQGLGQREDFRLWWLHLPLAWVLTSLMSALSFTTLLAGFNCLYLTRQVNGNRSLCILPCSGQWRTSTKRVAGQGEMGRRRGASCSLGWGTCSNRAPWSSLSKLGCKNCTAWWPTALTGQPAEER